jgi:hypothetical protein
MDFLGSLSAVLLSATECREVQQGTLYGSEKSTIKWGFSADGANSLAVSKEMEITWYAVVMAALLR